MGTLRILDDIPPFYPSSSVQAGKRAVRAEVVEISSDEDDLDDDDGQPESSTRITNLSPAAKRSVIIDSDSDDLTAEFGAFYDFLQPTRLKRQKVDHTDEAHSIEDFLNSVFSEDNHDLYPPMSPSEELLVSQTMAYSDPAGTSKVDDGVIAVDLSQSTSSKSIGDQTQNKQMSPRSICLPQRYKPAGKSKTKLEPSPYYDDTLLRARMYCGPGYERFPVVLESVPEHQIICDRWDQRKKKAELRLEAKRSSRFKTTSTTDTIADGSSSDDDNDDQSETELELLHQICEILPGIQQDFVRRKISDHVESSRQNSGGENKAQPNPAEIVSEILELPEYPKEVQDNRSKPASDGTGFTIKWKKCDADTKIYHANARYLLAGQFDRIPTKFITAALQEKQSLFDTYRYLETLNMEYDQFATKDRPYRRPLLPRARIEKKYTLKECEKLLPKQWANLVNEMQSAKQQSARDVYGLTKKMQEEAFEAANLRDHISSGNLVECQCCFDDEIPINRAVSCDSEDLHWFCFSCVRGLAESQVGLMKYEMLCMDGSECKARLDIDGVTRAIDSRLSDKLAFYQQQAEVAEACPEGLEQCPFCDFKAICDPVEVDSLFPCMNPDCGRVTCRKCHEDSHLPKTCEEFQRDKNVLSARHVVEEARSEAMIRTCPKCKVKIIKEMGCNKMQCTSCRCLMCYVCKADISNGKGGGYSHFNEPGAKCELYDKQYDRHEVEADAAEKEAIKKVQAEHTHLEEKQLQIETGTIKTKVTPAAAETRPRFQHHENFRNNHAHFPAVENLWLNGGQQYGIPDYNGFGRRHEPNAIPQAIIPYDNHPPPVMPVYQGNFPTAVPAYNDIFGAGNPPRFGLDHGSVPRQTGRPDPQNGIRPSNVFPRHRNGNLPPPPPARQLRQELNQQPQVDVPLAPVQELPNNDVPFHHFAVPRAVAQPSADLPPAFPPAMHKYVQNQGHPGLESTGHGQNYFLMPDGFGMNVYGQPQVEQYFTQRGDGPPNFAEDILARLDGVRTDLAVHNSPINVGPVQFSDDDLNLAFWNGSTALSNTRNLSNAAVAGPLGERSESDERQYARTGLFYEPF